MENVINIAKMLFMRDLSHDGNYFDFTLKDGYDTLYMAKYASEGNVFSFQNEESHMENVYRLLEKNFQDNVHIVRYDTHFLEKYTSGGIDGFIIDTTHIAFSEDKMIKLIELAVSGLKKNGRGLVIVSDERINVDNKSDMGEPVYSLFKKRLTSLSRDIASVIEMTEANTSAPTAYIIEKIK